MTVEVIEEIAPVGLVKCRGEIWTARSASGRAIGSGSAGRVVGMDGITLLVEESLEEAPSGVSGAQQ